MYSNFIYLHEKKWVLAVSLGNLWMYVADLYQKLFAVSLGNLWIYVVDLYQKRFDICCGRMEGTISDKPADGGTSAVVC